MSGVPPPTASFASEIGSFPNDPISVQGELFPVRLSSRFPGPNTADIVCVANTRQGETFFCKDDASGRPVRMIEGFCAQLAMAVGIAVPHFTTVEDPTYGETFFGSKRHISTQQEHKMQHLLTRPLWDHKSSSQMEWPGRYFSALYALDLFLNNVDRNFRNFVLHIEGSSMRVCAIDFAGSQLSDLRNAEFPPIHSMTVDSGRRLRTTHKFFVESAVEMVQKIEALSPQTIANFLRNLPEEWINKKLWDSINDFWSSDGRTTRLAALRIGLENGELL